MSEKVTDETLRRIRWEDTSYSNKLELLEEALRNRSWDTVIFVDTDEREYESYDVSYNKQIDMNGAIQTVITLEVR